MKKTVVYFLRHGEVHNPKQILYGRLPGFSLSAAGMRNIGEMALYFKDKNVKYLYTSPLLRARQTAQIIGSSLKLKPRISRLLNEVGLYYEGITLSEYKEKLQPYVYDRENIEKGQESIESIKKRMVKFLENIVRRHHGMTVLAVSHGDPITIIKSTLENEDFTWKYKIDNYLRTGQWLKVIYR